MCEVESDTPAQAGIAIIAMCSNACDQQALVQSPTLLGMLHKPFVAIELKILAGVDNVEACGPEHHRRGQPKDPRRSSVPRMAIQAAAGAMPRAKPSHRCAKLVKRLANE